MEHKAITGLKEHVEFLQEELDARTDTSGALSEYNAQLTNQVDALRKIISYLLS